LNDRENEKEKNMKTSRMVVVVAVLLAGTPAFAQMTAEPVQPGNMPDGGYHQTGMTAMGKITELDLAAGTVTLDNGTQFTLAPSLQFTSAPALGQDVEVQYDEQGGQRVARSIDQSVRGGNSD
jgi:hypothetical protein